MDKDKEQRKHYGYTVHEAARAFPLLCDGDRQQLRESMERHGFMATHPVVLYEGAILDGRNRAMVAKQLGIKPVTVEWSGEYGDPWMYVFATNVVRRHLSDAAKVRLGMLFEPRIADAMAKKKAEAAKVGGETGGRGRPKALPPNGGKANSKRSGETAASKVAEAAGISPRTYERGKRVAKEDPDLFGLVESGEMSLAAAEAEVKAKKEKKKKPPPRPDELPKQKAKIEADEIDQSVRRFVTRLAKKYPDNIPTIVQALRAAATRIRS